MVMEYERVSALDLIQRKRSEDGREAAKRAEGYTGKKSWLVIHEIYGVVQVYAADLVGAIWTAAKFWGVKPQAQEFHQSCRVMEV